jgi:hypothetical protein
MINLKKVTEIDDIKQGDLLLLNDGKETIAVSAVIVKVSERDGTEIIYDKKKNHYFNLGMYLEGKSWIKDLCVIKNSTDKVRQQPIITLNGKQIRDMAEHAGFRIVEGDYQDEFETEYSIYDGMTNGVCDGAGVPVRCYEYVSLLTDYPEEGCYPMGDEVVK